jgi:acetaldehyde dehydrogenase (acetylating)
MVYNKYKTIYFLVSVSPVTKMAFTFICKIIHFATGRWAQHRVEEFTNHVHKAIDVSGGGNGFISIDCYRVLKG